MTAPAPALPAVHFRPITGSNLDDCLNLELAEDQRRLVASPAKSLAQAYVNPALRPYGVYERASLGFEVPVTPLVGLVVLEVAGGVGFLLRLMIDGRFQGRGLGRAAVRESVRRLRLDPDVQMVATSHLRGKRGDGPAAGRRGLRAVGDRVC